MTEFVVSHPQKNLYLVTDSHLDREEAPFYEFVAMLNQLENPQTVVCLGDLFKVWLAPPKFWGTIHHEVMGAFEALRRRQVEIIFVIGNREVILPRKWNDFWKQWFPFTHLVHEDCRLIWGGQRYGMVHGDTINRQDLNYLRWRKIARSLIFEWIFRSMPVPLARRIAHRLESSLAQSNQSFKIAFPENEIDRFARSVLQDVDWYFVGHFHQDREIQLSGVRGKMRIVPDWLSQRAVLKISPAGEIETLYFQNGEFVQEKK
ncbi:MAG: metallophosphoesterase [SAR324 cluster bacterium]|nr:metallophosphoesterase [SAR324 cluster bacterium]